jgi:hypothetical protein
MARLRTLALVLVLMALGIGVAPTRAQREDPCDGFSGGGRGAVVVPSALHRTIQSAVCEVADHGTVFLREGTYRERIVIRGKHVRILGAGRPNRPEEWPELNADTPSELVPAEQSQGSITVDDGGGLMLRNVRLTGGDSQIKVVGNADSLDVMDAAFQGGWRGVLYTSPVAKLKVQHVQFIAQQYNGISISPLFLNVGGDCQKNIYIYDVSFLGQLIVGLLIKNCGPADITPGESLIIGAFLHDADFQGTGATALYLWNSGPFHLTDVHIKNSRGFGILAAGSTLALDNSTIEDTLPRAQDGNFGDGIASFPLVFPFVVQARQTQLEMHNVENRQLRPRRALELRKFFIADECVDSLLGV